MQKNPIKKLLGRFGYTLKKVEDPFHLDVHRYATPEGKLDYERYRATQEEGNKRKIDRVWVQEENMQFLAQRLQERLENPTFGICHGTRRGKEQEWLRQYLGCEVIGTEISETATQFPHTIQWDFHEVKPEWLGAVDFIYSNSLDHSYDPAKCLLAWMSCLRPGGICVLEHTSSHAKLTELDPFAVHVSMVPYLVLKWSEGRYAVREIIEAPVKRNPAWDYDSFLFLKNN